MKKKQSFFTGVLLLTAAGIAVKLLGFIYRVALTNFPGYGDSGNGIYGTGYQVYLVLYALSTTGFPAAIARLVAEKSAVGDLRGAHRVFRVSFWVLFTSGAVLSILFFLGAGYIARTISNDDAIYTMIAISPAIFFVSIMAVFRGYFQGLQDMRPQAYSQVIEQLGKTVFTIPLAFFLLPVGVKYAAAGATLGTSIGAAVGAVYLLNLYNKRKRELWENIRARSRKIKKDSIFYIIVNLLKIAVPISIGALVLTVANVIDLGTIMTQLQKAGFSRISAVTLYGIYTGKCYVLTHFPISVNMALATSLVPAIASALAVKNHKEASDKIYASMRLTMLIGLPSSMGLYILSQPVLKMLFPASSEGASLLALSSCTIIFIGLTQTLAGVLQGMGKAYVPAVALIVGALAKLLINYTLIKIPSINIKGAVYGTLACYIIAIAICFASVIKNFKLNLNYYNLIIKPIVATAIMGFATYYSYAWVYRTSASNSAAVMASIFISVPVFGLVLIVTGGIGRQDISALPFGKNVGNTLSRKGFLR